MGTATLGRVLTEDNRPLTLGDYGVQVIQWSNRRAGNARRVVEKPDESGASGFSFAWPP